MEVDYSLLSEDEMTDSHYEEPNPTYIRDYSQPAENYDQLRRILREIEETTCIVTEEWEEEQKEVVQEYSELVDYFRQIAKTKPERYQQLLTAMEETLDQVIDCILKYDKIELNFYEDFIRSMIKLYEYELDIDILCAQMKDM